MDNVWLDYLRASPEHFANFLTHLRERRVGLLESLYQVLDADPTGALKLKGQIVELDTLLNVATIKDREATARAHHTQVMRHQ